MTEEVKEDAKKKDYDAITEKKVREKYDIKHPTIPIGVALEARKYIDDKEFDAFEKYCFDDFVGSDAEGYRIAWNKHHKEEFELKENSNFIEAVEKMCEMYKKQKK